MAIKQKVRLEAFVDDLEAGDNEKQFASLRDWKEVYELAIRICTGQFSGTRELLDTVGGLFTPKQWREIHGIPETDTRPAPMEQSSAAARRGFGGIGAGLTDENGFPPLEPFEPSTRDNLPMFPVDRLPQGIADYVKAVSESVQVAPDMVATSILASVATAVQGKYMVHPVADWMEPLNLYAVTIAEPSERKSPVFKEVTRPIEKYEESNNQEMAPLIDEWKMEVKILKGRIEQAEKAAIANKSNGEDSLERLRDLQGQLAQKQEEELKPYKLWTDNSTPESIIGLLAKHDGKMGVFSAEGSTVFAIAGGRYSDGKADLGAFLNGFSGDTIRVTRVSRPEETIKNPALTLNLMVQPQVIQRVMENADFDGTGFLARFLYCFPRSMIGGRKFMTEPVSEHIRKGYSYSLKFLLDLNQSLKQPYILELTPDAVNEAERFHNEVERRLKDDLEPIEKWAGKWHGQIFRIAGIIHCLKCAEQYRTARKFPEDLPIDRETVLNAQEIGRYYLEHAKAAFSMGSLSDTDAERDAKAIWEKLKGKREISKRDLHRLCMGRAGFEKADGMNDGLAELERRGYIRMETKQGARGRASQVICVNPTA